MGVPVERRKKSNIPVLIAIIQIIAVVFVTWGIYSKGVAVLEKDVETNKKEINLNRKTSAINNVKITRVQTNTEWLIDALKRIEKKIDEK